MNREEKDAEIVVLTEKLANNKVIYLADTSALTVEHTNDLRRACFKGGVSMNVVKNTLLRKAMERVEGVDFSELYDILKGPTSVMISEVGNTPAQIIKQFRKKFDKPILKAAYVEESFYVGDNMLDALANLKSKNEVIAELVALLQSPAKNVISSLQSGKHTIAGLVKTLGDRPE
jgi:large subunit ribosomal protein L10